MKTLDYWKIIEDISKMDKNTLLKRYWLDNFKWNLYMQDYFLDKFYELELKWINCFYDKDKDQIKINDEYILWWYDHKYNDEFIYFFQWLVYWKYYL